MSSKVKKPGQCAAGHKMVGDNVVYGLSRGHVYRRCRKCRNAYHAAKGRALRSDERSQALVVLRNIAAAPGRFPKKLVADVLALADEIRVKALAGKVTPGRPFDFSKAVRNPFARRLRTQAQA